MSPGDKKHRPSQLGDVPKIASMPKLSPSMSKLTVNKSKFSVTKSKSAGDAEHSGASDDGRMRRHTTVMESRTLGLFSNHSEQKENSDKHEKKESDGKKK